MSDDPNGSDPTQKGPEEFPWSPSVVDGMPTLRELAAAIALAVETAVEPTGDEFVFTRARKELGMPPETDTPIWNWFMEHGEEKWINTRVPKPNDKVSIVECVEEWGRDCKAAKLRLSHNLPLDELIAIYTNQFQWVCFFAVRHPQPELREFFRKALRDRGYEPLPLSIEAECVEQFDA
jgi:hypothetical protein